VLVNNRLVNFVEVPLFLPRLHDFPKYGMKMIVLGCESFMKTLKREEIYANKYDDLEHLRVNIEEFIEQYYNRLRLHSALGYRPPEEFEQQIEASGSAESRSATMVFFENKENSRKISKGLLGKGTQMPSPSPDPFSCHENYPEGSLIERAEFMPLSVPA